jgi:hypothetical protein
LPTVLPSKCGTNETTFLPAERTAIRLTNEAANRFSDYFADE